MDGGNGIRCIASSQGVSGDFFVNAKYVTVLVLRTQYHCDLCTGICFIDVGV